MEENPVSNPKQIKKIQSYVNKFKEEELTLKIRAILNILKARKSLLQLLMLKLVLMTRFSREKAISVMKETGGLLVLELSSCSGNKDYLNTLVEIVLYLDCTLPLYSDIIVRYRLLDKGLLYKYLNSCCNLSLLFEPFNTTEGVSYLNKIVDHAYEVLPVINEEFNFIYKLQYYSEFNPYSLNMIRFKDKFVQQSLFIKLLKITNPTEAEKLEVESKASVKKVETLLPCDDMEDKGNTVIPLSQESNKMTELVSLYKDLINYVKLLTRENNIQVNLNKYENYFIGNFENGSISNFDTEIFNIKDKEDLSIMDSLKTLENIKLDKEKPIVKLDKELPNKTVKEELPNKIVKEELPNKIELDNKIKKEELDKIIEFPKSETIDFPKSEIKKNPTAVKSKIGKFKSLKKPKVKSKLDTTQLYIGLEWTKIPKSPNSIFSKVDLKELENRLSLDDFKMFEKVKISPISSEPPISAPNKTKANLTVFNPKKAMALNIAMGRINGDLSLLRNKILARGLDNEVLVKQLILYFPSYEEHSCLKKAAASSNFGNGSPALGKAEKLFLRVNDLDQFLDALKFLHFKILFEKKDFKQILAKHVSTYSAIINSKQLIELFGILLIFGNQLNNKSNLAMAQGFDIISLPKFMSEKICVFLKGKVDFVKLKQEIGEFNLAISTVALIIQYQDVRAAYIKDNTDGADNSREILYDQTNVEFDKLLEVTKNVRQLFSVDDEYSFAKDLYSFIDYFISERSLIG